MSLFETINNDIKKAMLAKEKEKLEALRAVKSAFLNAKTEKGADGDLSEEAELKIIQKLVKQRKDSAEMYKANSRDDLYEQEMTQVKVIEKYLPAQLSSQEIEAEVVDIIKRTGASSPKDMGKVMGVASKQLSGRAEGKAIAEVVKRLLTEM